MGSEQNINTKDQMDCLSKGSSIEIQLTDHGGISGLRTKIFLDKDMAMSEGYIAAKFFMKEIFHAVQ